MATLTGPLPAPLAATWLLKPPASRHTTRMSRNPPRRTPSPPVSCDTAAVLPARPKRGPDWLGLLPCLAATVLVLLLAWFKLSSLDTGYHLAYGRHFLATGRIVDRDPFLYPETAVPFVNANWGSQVVMALAERAAGASGLFALRLCLIAIIFAAIGWALHALTLDGQTPSDVRPRLGLWLAAAWMLAALAGYERFGMRPELFSYGAMSVMLAILVRGLRSWRSALWLAILQLAWVNLHSYFLVGLFLTGAFLFGEGLRWWRKRWAGTQAAVVRRLALAMALQVAACFANPWHGRGAVFPLTTLQYLQSGQVMGGTAGEPAPSAWSEISEFQSPFSFAGQAINHRTIEAYYVLLAVAACGVTVLAAQGHYGPAVAVLLLLVMSTQMRRNIAQFAFVAAPLTCGGLALLRSRVSLAGGAARLGRGLAALGLVAAAGWWTVGVLDGRFYFIERRINREPGVGWSDRFFSRGAVKWLAAHEALQPRLYVDYFASSNTLTWLPARFSLFVCTNTFAYEESTLATAFKLGLGRIDHCEFFNHYGVNVVLLRCGPDTQMLVRRLVADEGDWSLAWFDHHHVIFVRRTAEHLSVIPASPLTEANLDAASWLAAADGPDRTRALTLGTMVNVPMSLGWHRPAMTLLEEAIRLAPDYHEAWDNLGVCHGNLGNAAGRAGDYCEAEWQWRRAIKCWETVLRLVPDHAEARRYVDTTRERLSLLPSREGH